VLEAKWLGGNRYSWLRMCAVVSLHVERHRISAICCRAIVAFQTKESCQNACSYNRFSHNSNSVTHRISVFQTVGPSFLL